MRLACGRCGCGDVPGSAFALGAEVGFVVPTFDIRVFVLEGLFIPLIQFPHTPSIPRRQRTSSMMHANLPHAIERR
jgi:hypothetical protein